MASFDLKRAVLVIRDGTSPTPESITVKIGDGNLTYSEKVNREYILNRGLIEDVRNGDDVPLEVNFDFRWEYIKADTSQTPTVEDVLKQRGEAAAWVSTSAANCDAYSVDLLFTFTPACVEEDIEELLFPDFFYESLDHDAKAGTIACTGKCNVVEVTSTRTAQE